MTDVTDAAPDGAAQTTQAATPFIVVDGLTKAYGPTIANRALSFAIAPGEVIGLIGANGAGKSTLMRVLAGVTMPDEGKILVQGARLDPVRFSPQRARALGIRIVYQELSLCDSLTVAENFYLEEPGFAGASPLWHTRYRRAARESIAAIFPDSGIDVGARVGDFPIAQRQMIEIARAASDPKLRLLILDEPTSSLDARHSAELRAFIARRAKEGVAFIFISHKLGEVAATASRVLVMRNGRLVWQSATRELTLPRMVELMAGEATHAAAHDAFARQTSGGETLVSIGEGHPIAREGLALSRGEIVGLAGLEGNGQRAFLHLLQTASRRPARLVTLRGRVGFVSGDRVREGIFPLWDVLANASLSSLARRALTGRLDARREAEAARPWLAEVQLDAARVRSPIVELSGGNQQKVLMARALIADADIILLDDPTRGVDVSVKAEFYRLIRDAAARGKLVLWHSSEDIEFLECDRVLVFHDGAILRTLSGAAISEEAIVGAAFERRLQTELAPASVTTTRRRFDPFRFVPFATMAIIFATIAALNPNAASLFGVDLLLSAAVPLVLVAIGQMFVVGGSEIDLGIGAFAGLISVLSATLLVDTPSLGVAAIAAALAAYCALGLLIRLRRIPAIVVTLGASFVWVGTGYALQPTPGGSSPGWLTAATGFQPFGIPASMIVIVLAALAARLIDGSRRGAVLRGFGANPRALEQAGWSPLRTYLLRYLISGGFALLAGLALTGINTASDINAGGTYTLLSVAAVVVGGCSLSGGAIAPLGVVCGAVTLSLIGGLLGFLDVSTDYNAAVQGGLLIGVLLLRSLFRRAPA